MSSAPHIPGLARWPDLHNEYKREWRRLQQSCAQGCDAEKLASRYRQAAAQRNAILAIPTSRR